MPSTFDEIELFENGLTPEWHGLNNSNQISNNSAIEIVKNTHTKLKTREKQELLKQSQLPLWPDDQRAVPNGLLRSALFGAVQPSAKRYIDGEYIASLGGIELKYTGQSLDQGDLDVWEAVLHISRQQNLGSKCYTTTYHILSELELTDTGSNRRVLNKRLTRLVATAIELKQGRYEYIGSLITEVNREIVTGKISIVLNPKIIALFQGDQYTLINAKLCRALKKPLAKWLYRFYSTHAQPHAIKIETIHTLSRSEAKSLNDYKKKTLKNAIEDVSLVSAIYGTKFEYEIKGNLLHVKKSGSTSQIRHLLKK